MENTTQKVHKALGLDVNIVLPFLYPKSKSLDLCELMRHISKIQHSKLEPIVPGKNFTNSYQTA
jgi:hypothetical protein